MASTAKTQGPLLKSGWKDSKKQKIREFAVRKSPKNLSYVIL